MKSGTMIKTKGKCCKSGPRCKRCPAVYKRLEKVGLAERTGKRHYMLVAKLGKSDLKLARAR